MVGHDHDDRYFTMNELSSSGGGGSVHWDNISNVPAGFADNVDNNSNAGTLCATGYFLNGDGSCDPVSQWQTDPQVGSMSTSRVPRWNGSALVNGTLVDNGSQIGISNISAGYLFSVVYNNDNNGQDAYGLYADGFAYGTGSGWGYGGTFRAVGGLTSGGARHPELCPGLWSSSRLRRLQRSDWGLHHRPGMGLLWSG